MAESHEIYEHGPDPVAQAVLRYYAEQQIAHPEYLHSLSARLWDELPAEEREFRRVALSAFYPHDPEGNERAARAQLIFDYARDQIKLTKRFNGVLEEPRISPVPGQVMPLFIAAEYGDGEAQPPAA